MWKYKMEQFLYVFLIVYLNKESAHPFSGSLFLQQEETLEVRSVWVYI